MTPQEIYSVFLDRIIGGDYLPNKIGGLDGVFHWSVGSPEEIELPSMPEFYNQLNEPSAPEMKENDQNHFIAKNFGPNVKTLTDLLNNPPLDENYQQEKARVVDILNRLIKYAETVLNDVHELYKKYPNQTGEGESDTTKNSGLIRQLLKNAEHGTDRWRQCRVAKEFRAIDDNAPLMEDCLEIIMNANNLAEADENLQKYLEEKREGEIKKEGKPPEPSGMDKR